MNLTKEDWKRMTEAISEVHRIMDEQRRLNFKLVHQGDVDDEPWYTVQIQNQEVWFWLTQQEGSWSHYHSEAHRGPLVDMSEPVYLALVMRWS